MSPVKPMIAIVDDDASVCRALRRLLRAFGMDAETFASGQEFIDLITAMPSFHADCLVLDLQMPGMNGLEVQERLAALGRRLPIVFITAHDEAGARERALAAGAVAFMRKPFGDTVFLTTLRAVLGRRAGGEDESGPGPA